MWAPTVLLGGISLQYRGGVREGAGGFLFPPPHVLVRRR